MFQQCLLHLTTEQNNKCYYLLLLLTTAKLARPDMNLVNTELQLIFEHKLFSYKQFIIGRREIKQIFTWDKSAQEVSGGGCKGVLLTVCDGVEDPPPRPPPDSCRAHTNIVIHTLSGAWQHTFTYTAPGDTTSIQMRRKIIKNTSSKLLIGNSKVCQIYPHFKKDYLTFELNIIILCL